MPRMVLATAGASTLGDAEHVSLAGGESEGAPGWRDRAGCKVIITHSCKAITHQSCTRLAGKSSADLQGNYTPGLVHDRRGDCFANLRSDYPQVLCKTGG